MITIRKQHARNLVALGVHSSAAVKPPRVFVAKPSIEKAFCFAIGEHSVEITESELAALLREWRDLDPDAQF